MPAELASLIARHGIRQLLEFTDAFIILLDGNGMPVEWNSSFDNFKQSIPSANMKDFLSAEDQANFDQLIQEAKEKRLTTQGQLDLGSEGHRVRFDCILIPLPAGRALLLAEPIPSNMADKYQRLTKEFDVLSLELKRIQRALDIKQVELNAVMAQADEVAHTDALTFLPNRRQIIGDIQREVKHSERYGTPLSISMLDIDHFKKINDTYGHTAGDEVLRNISNRLREQIRNPDTIGRYGGEEFLIVLPHSELKAAIEQASRLCAQVREKPVEANNCMIPITVSVGVAQYRIGHENWEQFLNRADMALYQAKHNGGDQWKAAEA